MNRAEIIARGDYAEVPTLDAAIAQANALAEHSGQYTDVVDTDTGATVYTACPNLCRLK